MKTTYAAIAMCLCMTTFSPEGGAQPAPGKAGGQPASAKVSTSEIDAEVTGEARVLFVDGVKALSASRWAKAYAKFLAAWRIKPHYQIASNLGASERELGKYRDAAEHLSFYLADPKTREKGKEQARQHAQQLLDDVLTKIGRVTLVELPDGAEVKVDGVAVDRAPLPGALFVEPGPHTIEARLDEHMPKTESIRVNAGEALEVKLHLEKVAPPPPPLPPPLTASTASTAPVAPTAGPITPLPDRAPNRAVIIAGGSVAGVALVTGVVLAVLAQNKGAAADTALTPLLASGGANPCQTSACATIDSDRKAHDALAKGTIGAFVGAGAIGVATLAYALLAPRVSPQTGIKLAPMVGVNGGGIAVVGAWR